MQNDSRHSTFARIGRSYPRPSSSDTAAAPDCGPRGLRLRYPVTGALIALLSALGVIGWLLAR